MIKFTKPANLNGAELLNELNEAGIVITESPVIDGNGDFFLDIEQSDVSKAELVLTKHIGTTQSPELSIEEKLKIVGLTIDDLKSVLGL